MREGKIVDERKKRKLLGEVKNQRKEERELERKMREMRAQRKKLGTERNNEGLEGEG